jgi:hypothetical protein
MSELRTVILKHCRPPCELGGKSLTPGRAHRLTAEAAAAWLKEATDKGIAGHFRWGALEIVRDPREPVLTEPAPVSKAAAGVAAAKARQAPTPPRSEPTPAPAPTKAAEPAEPATPPAAARRRRKKKTTARG